MEASQGGGLFHSIAHNMRLDHEHERGFDVPQLELRESGRLQVLPGLPSDQATVTEVVPDRLEDMLEEVGPGGGVGNHVLHEEEGAALSSKGHLLLLKLSVRFREGRSDLSKVAGQR